MTDFYMKLTPAGSARLATALADGGPVFLAEMAVGDGGGAPVAAPSGAETTLVNEVWRGEVGSTRISAGDPSVAVIESVIAPDEGGFTVRELAIFDDEGSLFAYGNFPETYKPVVADGATTEMVLAPQVRVGAAAAVTLAIDPTILLATRQWTLDNFLQAPIGTVLPIAGTVNPLRWLRCDGASYLQSEYPGLFAALGLLPRLSWTKQTTPVVTTANRLRFANGNFVILGSGAATDARYSADNGASWAGYTGNLGGGYNAICWSGAKYVLGGAGASNVSNSPDLATAFTARAAAYAGTVQGLMSDGAGTVVAALIDGGTVRAMVSTDDGDSWTAAALPGVGSWNYGGCAYANGCFVIAAYASGVSYIYSSPDGATWTQVASGIAGSVAKVVHFAGAFYAAASESVGFATVLKSLDGVSWLALPRRAWPIGATDLGIAGLGNFPGEATLPDGILSLRAPANAPAPANYIFDDLTRMMQLTPPPLNGPATNWRLAWGNDRIMAVYNDGACFTAPLRDYDPDTEFVLPDIAPAGGSGALASYIRAR